MKRELMIVDDAEDEVVLLEDVFQDIDPTIQIRKASSGKDALVHLRSSNIVPPVMLLDLRMPGMSGIEVLRELKADPRLKRICVCAFSNGDLQRDICECYDVGASFYFKKPTGLPELERFAEHFIGLWFRYAELCKDTN